MLDLSKLSPAHLNIFDQLKSIGYPEEQAFANAMLWQARAEAGIARWNRENPDRPMAMEDWLQRYPLTVTSSIPFGQPRRTLHQFAGPQAQTANASSLSRACAMERSGADREQILQETGWFRGLDNQWRFEIDDSQARIRGYDYAKDEPEVTSTDPEVYQTWMDEAAEAPRGVALPLVLDHPKLFAAYPALQYVRVKLNPRRRDGACMSEDLMMGGFEIEIGDPYGYPVGGAMEAVLHEVQHIIQVLEGFARGGSDAEADLPTGHEIAATINAEYKRRAREVEASPAYRTLVEQKLKGLPADQWIHPRTGERNEAVARRRAESLVYEESELLALEEERLARVDLALSHVGSFTQGLNTRFAGYRHLAGEVEARNTTARAKLSEGERIQQAPWATLDIDPRDAVIRMKEHRRAAQADEPLRAGGADWPLIEELAVFQQLPDMRQFEEYERRESLIDRLVELYQSADWFKGVFLPVAHGWIGVTGSAKEAGRWQVTAFDAQMRPMSDSGAQDLPSALREALSEARFDLLAMGVPPSDAPADLTLSRSRVREPGGALLKVYHGTAEVKVIPGDSVPGDPEAIAELKAMAARFGIEDYTSVYPVLERLGRTGQRGRLGDTDADSQRAAELHEKSKSRVEPSRNALGFDAFRMPAGEMELGAHFGSRDQALMFGEPFEFYLDLRNPVRLPDLGNWHYQKVIAALREVGVDISAAEADQVEQARDHNEALRALMLAKGFDGVVYSNEAEGSGDSYIALKSESIFPAEQVVLPQMRVMNSPAFQSCFGDSVATVDGQPGGVPRVLYHGTDADIDVFFGREVTAWVSEDPALASGYAMEQRSGLDEDDSAPNVVPVYAAVSNPLTLDVDMNDPAKALRPTLERLGLLGDLRLIYDHADSVWEVVNNSLFMQAAKRLGYDGVRVRERGAWTWGIDEPSKLKSIFNAGEFSPESQQILNQSAVSAPAPAFDRWFDDSPVVTPEGEPQVMYHGSKTPDGLTVFVPGGRDPAAQSGDMLGVASYFTSDPDEASLYAGEQGAVLPVYLTGRLLNLEAPLLPSAEVERLTAFAERVLLPSDRARFSSLRKVRAFSEAEVEEARAFFEQERQRWSEVDGVMERSKPEVDKQGDLFLVRYTDFESPVRILTSDDAEALFRSVGWGNLPALGYDGVMLTNSEGRRWVAMHRPEGNVKSAIGNNGQYNRYSPRILDQSAYHGSPAEFDRFDPAVGGGVGRSYGYGIYLTADRGVADRYRQAMARQRGWVGPVAAAIAERFAQDYPQALRVEGYNEEMLAQAGGALVRLVEAYADPAFLAWADELAPAGRVYTAEIPSAEELLSWDLPVSEQAAPIRELIYANSLHTVPLQPGFGMNGEFARDGEPTGADIYLYLEQAYGSAQKASEVLGRLGIRGLTYQHLSFGSRDYVVFSPDDARIVRPAEKSAAFRDWFGASVLTEGGEAGGLPMVFYHGTRPGVDFEVFQRNAAGDGIYFTPDPLYAEGYTNPLFDSDPERADGPGVAGQIMPVYLRAERPFVIEAEVESEEWEQFVYRGLDCAALEAQGYDAAVLKDAGSGEIDQVIVFKPEQVKSAIGNSGAFDPASPSILNQSPAPAAEVEDLQLLRDGNPVPVTGRPVTYYYAKNLEKAPNMGALYGQDIEPAGDYLVVSSTPIEGGKNWEVGTISFANPLVLDAEEGTVAWKKALSAKLGGKKGKALSDAVRALGHDSIITFDKYGLSETISLGPRRVPAKERQDDLVLVMSPEFEAWFKGSAVADGDRPKKVYHGISHPDSDAPPIQLFDRLHMVKQGRRRAGQDTVGVWFTETLGNRGVEMYSGGGRIESGVIYPVYLSIKNPWQVSFSGMKRVANRLMGRDRDTKLDGEAVEVLRDWMKANGIDGIRLLHDPRDGDEFAAQQVWIALEPEQIRTAITSDVRYVPASQLQRAPVQAMDAFVDRAITNPAFRDWFAASQATVDGQPGSRPLVLFHGTQADFEAFDPERQGESVNSGDVGFFFTNFAKEASIYATADWWREDPQPNVIPVFLSLQNPKVLTCDPFEGTGIWYDNHGQEEARKALEEGYDGLIVRSTQPSMVMPNGEQIAMYVAFEPAQIKSALGNVGAYDRTDSRILFQSAAPAVWVNPIQMEAWTKKAGLSPEAVEAIAKIGIGQRGKPEHLMVEAQMVMGGGVLQYAIEHVGDLTDRMSPRHGLEWSYEETVEKATTCLRKLRSGYGFAREHAENLASNARYRGIPVERHAAEVGEALERYAVAHAELEAPTRIHALARDAAVLLGRQDFAGAADKLEALLAAIPTFEAYLGELAAAVQPRLLNQSAIPARATRGVLRVDEHGKNIVWEQGAYAIAVDNPQDAGYVSLWHEGKRVGAMSLGRGRTSGTRDYKTVASVEVEKGHRGRGLGRQMYRVALEFVGEQYRGIGGEHEQRSNSRQVPAIYRALGGRELESGDLVIDRAEPVPGLALDAERREENFRRWFGDSKVVDEAGQPLRVYHGTSADFDEFVLPGKKTGRMTGGRAIFFAEDPQTANDFARYEGARIIPAFLHVERPFDFRDEHHLAKFEAYLRKHFDSIVPGALYGPEAALGFVKSGDYGLLERPQVLAWMKRNGFDGVRLVERSGQNTYAVFSPDQIKSAIGNNGDFSPASPRILDQSPAPAAAPQAANLVEVDELAAQEQEDLVTALLEGRSESFSSATAGENYSDESVRQELFGLVDPLMVRRLTLPLGTISVADRSFSAAVAARYAGMSSKAPAILVKREGDGWVLVEGGHRYQAAAIRGDALIDVVDVTDILQMDWKSYLAGESLPGMPLKSLADALSDSARVEAVRREKNFRQWFAGSKVVDGEGQPLVVFHGTSRTFDKFEASRGNGYYFTDDRDAASAYAENAEPDEYGEEAGPNLIPAYLSLKNPLVLDAQWQVEQMDDGGEWEWEVLDHALYEAEEAGYDGAILRGFMDYSGSVDGQRTERRYNQYIAFRAEQIKSAVGNSGDFSPVNPNILAQSAVPADLGNRWPMSGFPAQARDDDAAFREWFGASRATHNLQAGGRPLVVYHGTGADIEAFSEEYIGSANDEGFAGRGFYFMDDPEWASGYAELAGENGGQANVIPVHLHMENPLIIRSYDELPTEAAWPRTPEQSAQIVEALRKQGHDGVVVLGRPGKPSEFVVFDPAQIKSAIGNRGTWDRASRKLLDQAPAAGVGEAAAVLEEQMRGVRAWMGRSVITENGAAGGEPLRVYHGSHVAGITEFEGGKTAYGIFFTPDPLTAGYYAVGDDAQVYEAFLKVERLADFDEPEVFERVMREAIDFTETRGVEDVRAFAARLYREGFGKSEPVTRFFTEQDGFSSVDGVDYTIEDLLRDNRIDSSEIDDLVEEIASEKVTAAYAEAAPAFSEELNAAREAYGSQQFYMEYQDDFMRAARALGYDGVVFADPSSTGASVSYVVFESSQIMLAPDAPAASPALSAPAAELREWLRESKVTVDGQVGSEPLLLYHASHVPNLVDFDPERQGANSDDGGNGAGFYFGVSEMAVEMYGEHVGRYYVALSNPYIHHYDGESLTDQLEMEGAAATAYLQAQGYDGVIAKDEGGEVYEVVAFSPDQIRSASAVSLDQAAWHGTPYQFESFELDKVGSSEGAAAYGWGVYFASQREVALWYSGALGLSGSPVPQLFTIRGIPTVRGTPEQKAADLVHGLGLSKAKKLARQWVKEARSAQEEGGRGLGYYEEVLGVIEGLTSARDVRRASGNVLKVDIPDADQLLDWDAPLASQPAAVLRAVERLSAQYDLPSAASGGIWYKALARVAGSDKQASFCLRAEGVPGISYLDGASRGATGGTRNFVIFDDARVSILGRESVAVLGQFAGEKAVGADLLALKLARKLARKGEADVDVFAETGWFRGVDGQWRFELDDSQAALRPEMVALLREGDDPMDVARVAAHVGEDGLWSISLVDREGASRLLQRLPAAVVPMILPAGVIDAVRAGAGMAIDLAVGDRLLPALSVAAGFRFAGVESLPLPAVLDYPELFAAYPALRDSRIALVEGVRSITSEAGDILLGRDLHQARLLPVALHEIQHVIQSMEGFAPGGSPEMAFSSPAVNPLATRGGLRAAKAILQAKLEEMARPSSLEEYARDAWRVPEGQPIAEDVKAAYAEYVEGFARASASGALSRPAQEAAAREWYRRLAGEMEARLVERRWRLSAEERRALLPADGLDVDPKDAIVLRYSASAACVADSVATASRLGAMIDEYLRVDTGLSAWYKQSVVDSAGWSKGECEKISSDLSAWLVQRGCDARVIFAQGLRGGLDAGAASDWEAFRDRGGRSEHFWHAAVLCDGVVVDLSGAQFGSRYAGVRLLSPTDFHAEWESIRVVREGRSVDLRGFSAGSALAVSAPDAAAGADLGGLALVHGLISRGALPANALREACVVLAAEGRAAEADDLRMVSPAALEAFGWARRRKAGGQIVSMSTLLADCDGVFDHLVQELADWNPARYGLAAARGAMTVTDLVRGMLTRLQEGEGVDRDVALGFVLEAFDEAGVLAIEVQQGTHRVRVDLDFAAESFQQALLATADAPRAQIAIGQNLAFDIRLLTMADGSSFAHETGHAFLEILRDQARMTTAKDSQIRADWEAVSGWLGLQGLHPAAPIPEEAHERFARGFELYLRKGVAPSSDLEGVFKVLADLLLQIYETLRSLFVRLPPDVEGVVDRMLADQESEANIGVDQAIPMDRNEMEMK